jgi:DNA replication protein DnaC
MNTNWHDLKIEFQQRRENAFIAREQRKSEVYKKVPQIKDIDQQISLLGISFSREALKQGLSPDSTVIFEKELNELIHKKKRLLKINGFPENYLDVEFSCDDCNDTGFLVDHEGKPGAVPCHCYRQLIVERFYDVSNLNNDGQTGFEFFNAYYYPDTTDGKNSISPRSQAILVRQKCLEFINNFEEPDCPNLYFCGPTGVGKTFFSKSIALEILSKGHTVLYLPAPVMFDIIYRCKYRFDDPNVTDSAYNDILSTELLIIDDLGTESPSAAKYTELLTILDYRSSRNTKYPCKTILSTNLEPQDLHNVYSERIVSRILGQFDILALSGDDIRLIKKLQSSG